MSLLSNLDFETETKNPAHKAGFFISSKMNRGNSPLSLDLVVIDQFLPTTGKTSTAWP